MPYFPYVIVEKENGGFDVRELPHVSEVGSEEAWTHNLKDMVDDWSTGRKESSDAWGKELIRGSQAIDDFQGKLNAQYLRFIEKLDNAYAGAYASLLQGAVERSGTAQGAMANQTLFDPQKMAESVTEAGMAGAAQTNQATFAAESIKALEKLTSAFGVIETKLAAIAARIDSLEK